MHGAVAAGLTASAMALAACSSPSGSQPEPPADQATSRETVWRDDFDGPRGARPDPAAWTAQEGGDGWGNEELQRYTTDPANASLDGQGRLVITADRTRRGTCWYGRCQYTSARLTTQGKVGAPPGRVEARIQLPHGVGLWPAFWMMGEDLPKVGWPQAGELDVMELVGDQPGEISSSVHGPGYVRAGLTAPYRLPDGAAFADGFHTFAIDRSPSEIVFSVDGQEYHRVWRTDGGENEWVFDQPFHIILNLAVGGTWPKPPPPETPFPAHMLVDYVAIFR